MRRRALWNVNTLNFQPERAFDFIVVRLVEWGLILEEPVVYSENEVLS